MRSDLLAKVRSVLSVFVLALAVGPAVAQTSRVSLTSTGQQANHYSQSPRGSFDGRFVVYESLATDMVPGVNNGFWHIYRRDTLLNATDHVSRRAGGQIAHGDCTDPDVSDDGRFVVFRCPADLISGGPGGTQEIYVKDMQSGDLTRVSDGVGGQPSSGHSEDPCISGDGRYVAFRSYASNLVADDLNGRRDVFLRDRQTGTTVRISTGPNGEESNQDIESVKLSRDGAFVVFHTIATTLLPGGTCHQVYLKDWQTGALERISVNSASVPADNCSYDPAVSADGQVVSFLSRATNLVGGDFNGREDVFVRNRASGTTVRASVSSSGVEANNYCGWSSVSADGRIVSFLSTATNLASGSFPTDRGYVYVRNLAVGETLMATLSLSGGAPNAGSANDFRGHALLGDGSRVLFESFASNLVEGDTNSARDIFARALTWSCTPPAITQQPSGATICAGDDVAISAAATGTPAPQYQWRKDGVDIVGATSSTYSIPDATDQDAGAYTLVASNSCGTAISNAADVVVSVRITEQPMSSATCDQSHTFYLRTIATGVAPVTYQWRKGGVELPGQAGAYLELEPWQLDDSGEYDCVITSGCGTSVTTAPATVTVQPPIQFTLQPQSQAVCPGSTVTFTADVNSPPPYTNIHWSTPLGYIQDDDFSLTVVDASSADIGNYTLFVTNQCGQESSQDGTLTLLETPTFVQHPVSTARCANESVTLTAWATGEPPLSYQWRRDNVDIAGATDELYRVPMMSAEDAGTYDVFVTNPCGTALSDPATLTLSPCSGSPSIYHLVELRGELSITKTTAHGLNDDGMVVGDRETFVGNPSPAAWTKTGTPFPHPEISVYGRAVNADNLIVGNWRTSVSNPDRAAIQFPGQQRADLHAMLPPGTYQSSATAVNSFGTVVLNAGDNSGSQSDAYVYFDSLTPLGLPDGMTKAYANDINDADQVCGTVYETGNVSAAAVWNGTTPTTLAPFGTDVGSAAIAIGADGTVVGVSRDSGGFERGVRWDEGAPVLLPLPAGASRDQVSDINERGQIVGTAEFVEGLRAVLWEDDVPVELVSLIEPQSQWRLRSAGRVNELGWIAGNGFNPAGVVRGYLLIPYHYFNVQPAGGSPDEGSPLDLAVEVVGATTLTYQWFRDGAPLSDGDGVSGSYSPALHITAVAASDAGAYSVVVTNGPASIRSDRATVVVNPACVGDVNSDEAVNLTDLSLLLAHFGVPSGATREMGDLDGDEDVDLTDLATLLANFGTICQ